jgi:disulfide bond formation protein DsbB
MADPRLATDRAARIFTLVFLVCFGLVGGALFLQHVKNLDPCPWCIVQRLAYLTAGLIALTAALHRPGRGGTIFYSVMGGAAALSGAAAGGYHVWLQSDPARASKCVGSPVERILDASGIGQWAPPLLQYDGPCTLAAWSLFGLSIPEWSLVWFVIVAVTFAATPALSNR